MVNRKQFARSISSLNLSQWELAVALLWYYRETQEYEERSASELRDDLHDEGFPPPNVTRLESALRKSRFVVKGKRAKTFKTDVRRLEELEKRFGSLLNRKEVPVSDSVIPNEWLMGTEPFFERIVHQINGTYESGFFDACAVLIR